MKNILILSLSLVGLTLNAQAAQKIECKLVEEVGILAVMPKVVSVVFEAKEGEVASSKNIKRGRYAYNFTLEYSEKSLNVVIQENNEVQDEVGSFSCDVARSGVFCFEPIFDIDSEHAFNFSCAIKR